MAQGLDPVTWCIFCKHEVSCFIKFGFWQKGCRKFESGLFLRCPECGSGDHVENNRTTIHRCIHCGTSWCIECGYASKTLPDFAACPHWRICDKCGREYRRVDSSDLVVMLGEICDKCEYHRVECQGPWECKNPHERHKWIMFLPPCPYDIIRSNGPGITRCPEIQNFLEKQGMLRHE